MKLQRRLKSNTHINEYLTTYETNQYTISQAKPINRGATWHYVNRPVDHISNYRDVDGTGKVVSIKLPTGSSNEFSGNQVIRAMSSSNYRLSNMTSMSTQLLYYRSPVRQQVVHESMDGLLVSPDRAPSDDKVMGRPTRWVRNDFAMNAYTVIIGKGNVPKENLGNRRLVILASALLSKYSATNEKKVKTEIVSQLVDSIHSAGGSFVKQDKDGLWSIASETAIREKCGYVFRDLLCDKYRSSSKSKAVKRRQELATKTPTQDGRLRQFMPVPVVSSSGNISVDNPRHTSSFGKTSPVSTTGRRVSDPVLGYDKPTSPSRKSKSNNDEAWPSLVSR